VQSFPATGFAATLSSTSSGLSLAQTYSGTSWNKLTTWTTGGTANFNLGSKFSTSAGDYTAAVSGVHFFTAHTYFYNLNGGNVYLLLTMNNTLPSSSSVAVGYYAKTSVLYSAIDTDLMVAGAFNLTAGQTVQVYVMSDYGGTYYIRSYTTFTGVQMTGTGFAFGTSLQAAEAWSSNDNWVNAQNWQTTGGTNFLSSGGSSYFSASSGQVTAPYTTIYLTGYNMVYSGQMYWGYGSPVFASSIDEYNGMFWNQEYYSPNIYTANMEYNAYLLTGAYFNYDIELYYFSSAPTALIQSTFSMVALPPSMPLYSFSAYCDNGYYLYSSVYGTGSSYPYYYSVNGNPVQIGYWYDSFNSYYSGGLHQLNTQLDTTGGNFQATQEGVYYCVVEIDAYYDMYYSYINFETELRLNGIQDKAGIGYYRHGWYEINGYYYGYMTWAHSGFFKMKSGDVMSVWVDYDMAYFIFLNYSGATSWGCTLVGTY
jgi:hypothetical protein